MEFYKRIDYSTTENCTLAINKNIEDYKLIYLSGLSDRIPINDFYAELADNMGKVLPLDEDLHTGKQTGKRWIEIAYDPMEPNRYRTSNTRQPLHTDNSYFSDRVDNINFFYCLGNSKIGGATFFLEIETLLDAMEIDGQRELITKLMEIPVNFSKDKNSRIRPIIVSDNIGFSINYNYYCLDQNNTKEAIDLVKEFQQYLETRINNAGIYLSIKLKEGEAVFFHDQRLLHGRYAFMTPNKGDRTLIKGTLVLPSRDKVNAC